LVELMDIVSVYEIMMNKLLGRQGKIRGNIRLLENEPQFSNLVERYGRGILFNLKIRKYIGMYNANDLLRDKKQMEEFCIGLENIAKKENV
jgi:hypothetical protein